MKVKSKKHKAILHSLFFSEKDGQMSPVTFPIEKLGGASSGAKKLIGTSEVLENGGIKYNYDDSEQEFTPSEVAILKDLFDRKSTWSVEVADIVFEIKNLFEGK